MMVNSPSAVESGEELVKKRPATPGREQVWHRGVMQVPHDDDT
jgi:hypothetical protein